jgi:signal transduction histidine kinase
MGDDATHRLKRSDEHKRDLEALCAIAAAASGGLPLDDGLREALLIVMDRLAVEAGALFILDERGEMRLVAARGVASELLAVFEQMKAEGLARVLARPNEGWLLRDGTPEWSTLRAEVRALYRCVGATPLTARNDVVGALLVGSPRIDALPDDATLFLTTAGRQIGIAADNGRLLAREQRRREQAEALRAAGLALAGRLDLDALLGTVLEQIARVVPSDSSAFFLTVPGGGSPSQRLVASRGFQRSDDAADDERSRHPLLGEVERTLQPVIVDDVRLDPRWTPGPKTQAVRSWMGIPLLHDGVLAGCLTLDRHEPGWYTAEHAQLAASFAAQAALAVVNARLHEQAQARLDRLGTMYRAVQSLTETVDLQTVIEAATQSAVAHTGFPMAAVVLLDPHTRRFDFMAAVDVPEPYQRIWDDLRIDAPELHGGALEEAMRTHRACVVRDVKSDTRTDFVRELLIGCGIHAYGCVPLVAKGRFEGALYVYDRRPRPDMAADLAFLEALADQAAVAIANARLYETADESLRQTRALQRVTATLSAGLDLQTNLNAALSAAQQLFGADRAAVFLDDPETGARACAAAHGLSDTYLMALARRYPSTSSEPPANPDHLYIADAPNDPRMDGLQDAVRAEGIHSMLFVAMNYRGRPTGILVLYHDSERRYTPSEIGLARTLADQAAIAFEHARLFAQAGQLAAIEERNRLARELHDSVTQSIFSISLIAQALPALIERQPERATERVQRLGELARGALAEMRALIFQMRPAQLEQDGLPTAIRRYAAAFESREGVQVQVEVEGERQPLAEQEETLFRIVQEALNNIAKHAHATTVEVLLRYEAQAMHVCVHDDGVGFEARLPRTAAGQGFGMVSMRQRAEELGGSLQVESAPGEGTTVRVDLPVATALPA